MDTLINLFVTVFQFLTQSQLLGLPIIVWLVLPAVFAVIIDFIRGRK